MEKQKIKGANANPGAPLNWDADRDGPCGALPVRVKYFADSDNVQHCESAWKPTAAELEALNRGGAVILHVVGWQVPVALWVEENATE